MKIKVSESGYMDASKAYSALEDGNYFTSEELVLVTDGWGLNTDTLDRICQVRYGMDADQVLGDNESCHKKASEDAPWEPTMKKVKDLKKGDYFTVSPIEEPKESQVWVLDSYDRTDHTYTAYRFSDINSWRTFKGDKPVCTGFTF